MFLFCSCMPVRRIYEPTGGRLTVGGLEVGDLIRAKCWKCERRYRLAPHDLIDRYPPGEVLKVIAARDMRCRRCGWREMLLEVWRATHPDPAPPPSTMPARSPANSARRNGSCAGAETGGDTRVATERKDGR